MSDKLNIANVEETREIVDRAFCKAHGKSYRANGADCVAQIEHDFPWIFGGSERPDP